MSQISRTASTISSIMPTLVNPTFISPSLSMALSSAHGNWRSAHLSLLISARSTWPTLTRSQNSAETSSAVSPAATQQTKPATSARITSPSITISATPLIPDSPRSSPRAPGLRRTCTTVLDSPMDSPAATLALTTPLIYPCTLHSMLRPGAASERNYPFPSTPSTSQTTACCRIIPSPSEASTSTSRACSRRKFATASTSDQSIASSGRCHPERPTGVEGSVVALARLSAILT
jgi:hypothetical protein